MAYTYAGLKDEYQRLWDTMRITRSGSELHRVSQKIIRYQAVYRKVEAETGIPWWMVGVIHLREAGEQDIGRWQGCLHNGDKVIGNGRRTHNVPANRGPFSTWHEAALDALRMKGFHKISAWPMSRVLWALEPYNGYGYRNKGLRSPYLWAGTNWQQRGKYVSDGQFDRNVMDTQIGCAPQIKYIIDESRETLTRQPAPSDPPKTDTPKTVPPVKEIGFGAGLLYLVSTYWPLAVVLVAVLIGSYLYLRHRKLANPDTKRSPKTEDYHHGEQEDAEHTVVNPDVTEVIHVSPTAENEVKDKEDKK